MCEGLFIWIIQLRYLRMSVNNVGDMKGWGVISLFKKKPYSQRLMCMKWMFCVSINHWDYFPRFLLLLLIIFLVDIMNYLMNEDFYWHFPGPEVNLNLMLTRKSIGHGCGFGFWLILVLVFFPGFQNILVSVINIIHLGNILKYFLSFHFSLHFKNFFWSSKNVTEYYHFYQSYFHLHNFECFHEIFSKIIKTKTTTVLLWF